MYLAGALTEGELWNEGFTRKSRQFDTKAVHTKLLPDSSHTLTPTCSNQGEQLYCLQFVSSSSVRELVCAKQIITDLADERHRSVE